MALGANELLLELKVKKAIPERMARMELTELMVDLDQWLDMEYELVVINIIQEMIISNGTI
jgi:hypothetical protein